MNYLTVKNWSEFQHYKDRNPPWIKLHRSLVDNYEFSQLPDHAKGQLMLIWILAAQKEGRIPQDAKFLERKLGFTEPCALQDMIRLGFLIPEHPASDSAIEPLADCKQDATDPLAFARSREESQRREEKRQTSAREEFPDGFPEFWSRYPRKASKPQAVKAWRKLKPDATVQAAILAGIDRDIASPQWTKSGGEFIPLPATYLNNRRWEDAPASGQPSDWQLRAAV